MSAPDERAYSELFRIGSRGGGAYPEPGDLFESVIEDIYTAVLSPGDFALDGGAHVGRHSFPMAARVGPQGRVLAVEAYPKLARKLVQRANKHRAPQVQVIDKALYDRMGRVSFHCTKQHPAYSGIEARTYDFKESVQVVEAEATTIDFLMSQHGDRPLRFVKLDLEGGELRALQGGRNTLNRSHPLIVFENDQEKSAELYGYAKEEWFGLFVTAGYETFTLWGQPYGRDDWGRRDIPWYFIAAAANTSDVSFVREQLPHLLLRYLRPQVSP
jgi:FkbM family methyltransferase